MARWFAVYIYTGTAVPLFLFRPLVLRESLLLLSLRVDRFLLSAYSIPSHRPAPIAHHLSSSRRIASKGIPLTRRRAACVGYKYR